MAEVFTASNETDLSEWDTTVVDSGDLAQSGAAALGGTSGGMALLIDDANAIYVQGNLSATGTVYRYEFYLDPNTLAFGTNEGFQLVLLHNAGTTNHFLDLVDVSGVMKLRATLRDDANSPTTGEYTLSGGAQRFEVYLSKATGVSDSNAFCYVYADGDFTTPVIAIEDIDLWDNWQLANRFRIGAISGIDAGTSGTFYLDEVTVRNDATQIGATASTPPTITGPGNTTLGAHGAAEAIPCTVVVTDGSTATMRVQCTSGKGTVDLADLGSGVSVSSGSRASTDVTFSGTPTQINNAALDIEYTGAGDSEKITDTAVVVTIDDGVNSPVSDTFTVTTVRNTIAGTQVQINAALATLGVTVPSVGSTTMEMFTRDAIGTDTDTSVLTATQPGQLLFFQQYAHYY